MDFVRPIAEAANFKFLNFFKLLCLRFMILISLEFSLPVLPCCPWVQYTQNNVGIIKQERYSYIMVLMASDFQFFEEFLHIDVSLDS